MLSSSMIRRIRPIVTKEFRQISRDRRSLGVLLVLPAFMVFLIGFALNFDVKHIPVALYDQDRSQLSREFARGFFTSEYFRHAQTVESSGEIDRLLNESHALIALVIPSDFSRRVRSGEDATVQVLVDGSNANTATTAIGYVNAVVQNYSTAVSVQTLARYGREPYRPIDLRPKVWYNPELRTAKFLVPGLIGFILMLTGVISTSLSVVREKERGTMDQMMISPLRNGEIIVGKTIPYLIIALLASTLVLTIGVVVFGVTIRGSLLWLYAGIFIFLLAALGQGLLISTIAETQQVAFLLSVLSSLLPTFLLSGFVFPISSMPVALQVLTNLTPSKFFLTFVRSIILKGAGPSAFWDQLVYLGLFAALTLGLSSVRLMKRPA